MPSSIFAPNTSRLMNDPSCTSASTSTTRTSNNQQNAGAEEDPPSYESLIQQQRLGHGSDESDGKTDVVKPLFKRQSFRLVGPVVAVVLVLGLTGFLYNYFRAQDINSEIHEIKHNHISDLRTQTAELDSRADELERNLRRMLIKIEAMTKEIRYLRGEAEKADELRTSSDGRRYYDEPYLSSALPIHSVNFFAVLVFSTVMHNIFF
eukprot:TRINITY_DN8968_c0_g1_i1.p1 TRINITY_DN8968_c0_g1~~TRINITY_DN8968_c0_g1_i1.p1  ORF type:complete len:207 (+),score=27.47 TRINITY_DN8968_c0_g1_i1:78-698(+)